MDGNYRTHTHQLNVCILKIEQGSGKKGQTVDVECQVQVN